MARISEIVVAIEAEGTEKVLAALNQVEGAQVKTVKTTKQLGAQTKEATATASAGWATLVTGVNQAIGVLQTVVQVGKAVYDFTKQGAQLEFMAGKFDRLSLAAGTTSDVLLNDLRKATQGTRSDMELMASASDFMALGFAKTSDEAVRLSTVAGALNMNMNQLVLTLANQTTMRFDQLGVSVVGFQEKVDALVKSGMSANAAFQEAFLQQAEEQIRKVGNAADSSVGSFMRFEASVENLANALKTVLTPSVEKAVISLTKVSDALSFAATNGVETMKMAEKLKVAFESHIITDEQYKQGLIDIGFYENSLSRTTEGLEKVTIRLTAAYQDAGYGLNTAAISTGHFNSLLIEERRLLKEIPDAADGAGAAIEYFAISSEKAAYAVDNFLEKAGLFKADFEEMFDLSKNLSLIHI